LGTTGGGGRSKRRKTKSAEGKKEKCSSFEGKEVRRNEVLSKVLLTFGKTGRDQGTGRSIPWGDKKEEALGVGETGRDRGKWLGWLIHLGKRHSLGAGSMET